MAAAVAAAAAAFNAGGIVAVASEPYASMYEVPRSPPTLIRRATVLTGSGLRLDGGDVLMVDGRIQAVGMALASPPGSRVIEADGKWVTPGLIDVHSHLGVAASPGVSAHADLNEFTAPTTPAVWAEHAVWPQDPGFEAALAGGVTTLHILPGSSNLIGGRSVTLKNVAALSYQPMKFPGAPQGLKMACGENPKKNYGARNQFPMTRMGNVAGYRQAFADAQDYQRQRAKYAAEVAAHARKGDDTVPAPVEPKRDLGLETLAAAMSGELLVHIHCYRSDEMMLMLDLAREFGLKISAFHHAVEAYKIADELARSGTCVAAWADWWGFKMEAFDAIQENIVFADRRPGSCAIVHSDSDEGTQRLNQEAAKAMMRGRRMGWAVPPERAIAWITANAARALGIAELTGSLEAGKAGDVVLWDGDPFSVYAQAEQVYIDGALVFERGQQDRASRSDFRVGLPGDAGIP